MANICPPPSPGLCMNRCALLPLTSPIHRLIALHSISACNSNKACFHNLFTGARIINGLLKMVSNRCCASRINTPDPASWLSVISRSSDHQLSRDGLGKSRRWDWLTPRYIELPRRLSTFPVVQITSLVQLIGIGIFHIMAGGLEISTEMCPGLARESHGQPVSGPIASPALTNPEKLPGVGTQPPGTGRLGNPIEDKRG